MLSIKQENRIIRLGLILFWTLFWLLNVIDKIILHKTTFWVGKDRATQFVNYFASIGIENVAIPYGSLLLISIAELIAVIFFTMALIQYLRKNKAKTRYWYFLGIFVSLLIFSFFAIGDQVFGERAELLEHTTYWIALIISWFIFVWAQKTSK